jgi:hypothetical protein
MVDRNVDASLCLEYNPNNNALSPEAVCHSSRHRMMQVKLMMIVDVVLAVAVWFQFQRLLSSTLLPELIGIITMLLVQRDVCHAY